VLAAWQDLEILLMHVLLPCKRRKICQLPKVIF
jgi:hypothetical protein